MALGLLALGAAGCGSQQAAAASKPQLPTVATAVVQAGALAPSVSLSGIVAPYQNVAISSTLAEPVDAVYVQEGDHVTRGEVLARLDTTDLTATLNSFLATAAGNAATTSHAIYQGQMTIAQSNDQVRSAQAALQQAQQTLAKDTTDLGRYTQLLANGYVPQQQVAQETTLVANDQQTVRSAQAALASAQEAVRANGSLSGGGLQASSVRASQAAQHVALAQADQVRAQIAKATIVSPIDGVVVNRNVNPGEYPGSRQLFTLQQVDPAYAVLTASGQQIAPINTGAPVQLTSPDLPRVQLRGTVAGALNQVNPGSTNFTVKVQFNNPGERLRSGQIITGRIALAPVHGFVIPGTAFTDSTSQHVLIVRGGVTHQVSVVRLAGDANQAVVSGLTAGDQIVVNGAAGISDGMKVAVR